MVGLWRGLWPTAFFLALSVFFQCNQKVFLDAVLCRNFLKLFYLFSGLSANVVYFALNRRTSTRPASINPSLMFTPFVSRPSYNVPMSILLFVLASWTKQTSLPISLLRRNSLASNAYGLPQNEKLPDRFGSRKIKKGDLPGLARWRHQGRCPNVCRVSVHWCATTWLVFPRTCRLFALHFEWQCNRPMLSMPMWWILC